MDQVGTTTEHEVATTPPHGGGRWARHPSPKEYVRIAIILGLVTAAEVAIYYIDWVHDHGLLIPLLFLFAALKFTLVVLWFMHLRFDSPVFSILFAGGLTLVAALLLVVLASLGASLV